LKFAFLQLFVILILKRSHFMTKIKTNAPGTVSVADDAIAVIAGTAALEADGVAGLAGHFVSNIKEARNRKHMARGVNVAIEGGSVTVSADITVKYGVKVQEVCRAVQEKIKTAIETMTGITATEVNVTVTAQAGEKQRFA
jgi:uncharacterized alkaline shock family protein YloU